MSESPPPPLPPADIEKYRRTVHNVALAALVTCPILALLPPRKFDIYTIGLIATTGYSANFLVRESSGRSIWQTVTRQPAQIAVPATSGSVVGELQREARSGNHEKGWKAERQKEIKEDVEEGKDFSDMIIDQIWEVWNQGKVKKERDED